MDSPRVDNLISKNIPLTLSETGKIIITPKLYETWNLFMDKIFNPITGGISEHPITGGDAILHHPGYLSNYKC